jgi:Na+/proline symporter
MQDSLTALAALAILISAAVLSASLILALSPWLVRYAVAKPNARTPVAFLSARHRSRLSRH